MKKLIILMLLLSGAVWAQDKVARLDSLMTSLYHSGAFNGNILVAEKGKVIYQKSFGLADEKSGRKLNAASVFELASVSKQFTAMGIVQLQKEGKLAYDDKLAKYIPELSFYEGITLQHLLTHTAGLPDYMELMDKHWDKTKIATNDDVIKLFAKLKPAALFTPNARWEYSNTGYMLLATIIERVSKKPFGDYLAQKIFKPLAMNNTYVYRRRFKPENKANYAQGYIYSDSLQRKILPDELGRNFLAVYLDGIVGDGMVNSNLEDLLKWDRALYADKLVNAADKEKIFSSYKTAGDETDYGFGWMIWKSKVYGKVVQHTGGWAGYITYIGRDIDNDKTIIVLQNNATPKTLNPSKHIRKIMYNLPVDARVQLPETVLKLYAGQYKPEGSNEREILYADGKLYAVMGGDNYELIPLSKTRFMIDGYSPEVYYEFITGKDGKVEKYRVRQPEQGVNKTANKVK